MSDIPLPTFLDPLLNFLEEHISPELNSFIVSFISHSLALLTAFISLVSSLMASKPWEWDAQTIIPPLISLLAAYLALVSLYRTTSWLFRTSFWFIKWGTILGVLAAGAGWYMGNQDINGGGRDLLSSLGAVLGTLNGNGGGGNDAGARTPNTTPRSTKHHKKPWESFANQWQYREDPATNAPYSDAQRIMSETVATANRILTESGWLNVAKNILTPAAPHSREDRRTKGKSSQSSR